MKKATSVPGGIGGGFHAVHPDRDLESNWEVDLAKKLEEYLFKIFSGDITGEEEGHIPINFAEAALLLQGSIQVYSRKVEYLYTLVLRALEFLSQKRQQTQLDGASDKSEESCTHDVADEENDHFWGSDDIPVKEKNSLDITTSIEVNLNYFVKLPANLVVLEVDCLDAAGDGGEMESYLLATTDLYRDFIVLDTSDAFAVLEFQKARKGTGQNSAYKESLSCKGFYSPTRCSGGTVHRSSAAKSRHSNSNFSPQLNCRFDVNNTLPSSPASAGFDNCKFRINMDGCDASGESDGLGDDDPWKPLNPHEPGNFRVKPFRKVKVFKRNGIKTTLRMSINTLFPLAKLHGPISPELMEMWGMRHHAYERQRDSEPPPLYESYILINVLLSVKLTIVYNI